MDKLIGTITIPYIKGMSERIEQILGRAGKDTADYCSQTNPPLLNMPLVKTTT